MSGRIVCLLSVVAVAIALVTFLPSTDAVEADTFDISTNITGGTVSSVDIKYHIVSENEVEVSNSNGVTSNLASYTKCDGELTIPGTVTYDGKTYIVIGIGYCAFWDTPMTSITLPDTLKYIGEQAFSDIRVEKITIPASVTKIGDKAFSYAETKYEDNLVSIEFESGSALEEVGSNLFEGRGKLKDVVFPSGVKDLNIRSVGNPYGQQLSGLNLGALNGWYDAASEVRFADGSPFSIESGLLYDGTTLVANLNHGNSDYIGAKSFEIREGTTAIGDAAMISKDNGWTISSITIPSSVESIGKSAFRYSFTSSTTVIFEGTEVPIMNNSFGYYGTVIVPQGYSEGFEEYFDFSRIYVLENDGSTTNTTTETETDDTGQTITTTTITTKDEDGITASIEIISTTTQDDTVEKNTINTTATIRDGKATVSVEAGSGESLKDISGQIDKVKDKLESVDTNDVSVTITEDNKGTVILTTTSLNHLLKEGDVRIEIDSNAPQDLTSGQIATIGECFSYDFSAIVSVTTSGETVEEKISNLGGNVTVYIPYNERMGDRTTLGIYFVDEDGTKTLMDFEFDETYNNGSFKFQTNHFSTYAVLPLEDDDEDPPYIPPYDPDDDDSYIPPAIVVEEDSGETTKVVACAAAAVVAALMAAFLIIDGRRK